MYDRQNKTVPSVHFLWAYVQVQVVKSKDCIIDILTRKKEGEALGPSLL